jgi:hypothetical protein
MPANKRIRTRRTSRTAKDIAMDLGTAMKQQPRQLARKSDDLQNQIHRLECFIAAAPSLKRQHRLENYDIIPPMQRSAPVRKTSRLPLQQQMALRRQRLRLLAEFGIVSITVAGLAGWLNHCFNLF